MAESATPIETTPSGGQGLSGAAGHDALSGADAALAALLSSSGIALSAAAVQAVIAGVAAAPEGHQPDAWIGLISGSPSAELRSYLHEVLARVRAEYRDSPLAGERRQRLAALRQELRRRRLAGMVVPHADEYQNEQLPPGSMRLAWLIGFTGSAGVAVVLRERAALFVDGRYTVQAGLEADGNDYEICHAVEHPPEQWIAGHLQQGGRLGIDPWLHSEAQARRYRAACGKVGGRLVPLQDNPVDRIWTRRPPPPLAPVVLYDVSLAGQPPHEKRECVADVLGRERQDAAVITAPDSIAWLLNFRGGDVAYSPAPLAFAIVHADRRVQVFLDPRKLLPGVYAHLGEGVGVHPPDALVAALDELGAEKKTVRIDEDAAPFWIADRLRRAGAVTANGQDPCALPKAAKNSTELAGIRAAHRRDGAALTRFLAWLDQTDVASTEQMVTEFAAAAMLEDFRRRGEGFRGNSFATISAAGANGAIVHYRVTPESDRPLTPGELYLVDSGGQYLDGTTDVTRTVVIGGLDAESGYGREARDRFTRVLKGHIAIASVRFPVGTTGPQLDVLARHALWQAGLDYDHGTGHGVGAYLNVHEGPQRISKIANKTVLKPGMVISNEPGYYKTGAYGIRIENLVAVAPAAGLEGAEREFLSFETLTLAPIDRRLIDAALLTPDEIAWLDCYHRRVRGELTPHLDAATAQWLGAATGPLGT